MTTQTLGISDISFAEYHAIEAWGSGSLRAMRRGPPARVLYEKQGGKADTDATILGSAVHCSLLEPDRFLARYAVKPEGMSFATKDGKAWRDDPDRAGRTILSHDAGATVQRIREALIGKAAVLESITNATAREASLVWQCSITGELCKARPDWFDDGYIYDLKVSRHASGGALAYRAYCEGWMHQIAHYRTGAIELGLPVHGGRLVVVEPTEPHFVYTLEVKGESLDMLEAENIDTLRALRECRIGDNWPGTPDQWKKIEIPANALALMGIDTETGEDSNTEEVF